MRLHNLAVALSILQLTDARHGHGKHLHLRDDGTTTGSEAAATTTAVTLADNPDNLVDNAGFSDGLDGFKTTGNVEVVEAAPPPGEETDGDDPNYVVEMVVGASSGSSELKSKRASLVAAISAFINNLIAKKTYTVQFQYAVVTSNLAKSCQLNAYMGSTLVGSTPFFPVVAKGATLKWLTFTQSLTITGTSSTVKTSLTCGKGGSATVQVNAVSVVEGTVSAAATSPTTTSKPTTTTSPTTSKTSTSTSASPTSSVAASSGTSKVSKVDSTILVIAADTSNAQDASLGLLGYGIPYETLIVPKEGIKLPVLNSSLTSGNYGGIIITSSVAYDMGTYWGSAITDDQWNALYAYQTDFHVRMVRINDYPGPKFGTSAVSIGCCEVGNEQLISFTDTAAFATANIKANAGLSTQGLYHVPATVTDSSTTKAVAKFGTAIGFSSDSVAAVINNFSGREQFVWFISFAPEWSQTSAFLQHAHIHWMTRGVFLGKRKTHLSPQIDDVQLSTGLYSPAGTDFKIRTSDLEAHLPPGARSQWNGDIIAATAQSSAEGVCKPDYAVDYDSPSDTALEWAKPLGSGTNLWPSEWTTYKWTKSCAQLDDFAAWFLNTDNLNQFAHVSHTFSHMELNNATYADAKREIQFNQAWMSQMGIDKATRFSKHGLIPPAITGLHNGDVIQAWLDNGITNVVGDNTRPVLRNSNNKYWPLISTVASNGYDGLTIVPRYATTIYYNCDTAACTTLEWINTSGGSGTFTNLLSQAKNDNTRYLLSLQADPYMFHQANMRQIDVDSITIGSETGKMSLVTAWTETIVQELVRLTNWPIISQTHDEFTKYFLDRMAVDKCSPKLFYGYSSSGAISSVTVSANSNTCSVPIPVTIPSGSVTASGGSVSPDQVGSEPPIQWVTLKGSSVTLSLSKAVST
ncbi:hypothetical protein EDB81DRAFT_898281 [Dactylonectria macrodidyma]|uniref:Extracellular serine-rich protein n=1 Tax=Dactylonectria macrodidyma TaxID=307937 RepID=A0A9P9FV57_9HYPO|nr:hypothetical protein EDB81DRAFT_898281 [Dactylonectria macrodidyma]